MTIKPLWSHQHKAIQFGLERLGFGLFMDMGTGKSRVVIDLIRARGSQRNLIVCPPAMIPGWYAQFQEHSPAMPRMILLTPGTTAAQKAQMVLSALKDYDGPIVFVVNYESVWRGPLADLWRKIKLDTVVCDEAQYIKSPGSKVSKYMGNLANYVKWRIAATGTPLANSPLDVYGIYRFLDKRIFGTRYDAFRDRYSTSITYGNARIITGYINEEELHDRMYTIGFRVNKNDVLDLPPEVDMEIPIVLTDPHQRLHDDIWKEAIGELESGERVVPSIVLDKINKCQQIANGFAIDEDGKTHDWTSEKTNALYDVLSGINEPVVVFAHYRHDFVAIERTAKALGRKYAELSGRSMGLGVGSTYPLGVEVFGVQMQAGSFGIDLTRSCYGIYFTHPLDLGIYTQSRARLHRPGQSRKVTYIHLMVQNSVDERVYRALTKKQDVVTYITDILLQSNQLARETSPLRS